MSLSNINTILSEEIKRIQCIMETSRTEREASICLSVFEGLLDEKLGATRVEPKVVVVTNINPKLVGGSLFLNETSGIHFCFDNSTSTKCLTVI